MLLNKWMNICFSVDEETNWESNLLKETDDDSKAGMSVHALLNTFFEYDKVRIVYWFGHYCPFSTMQ